MSILQALPSDPSAFAAFDQLGVPAVLAFLAAVLLYLLWRSEKRANEAEAKLETYLRASIDDYKERDRTLELIAKARDEK